VCAHAQVFFFFARRSLFFPAGVCLCFRQLEDAVGGLNGYVFFFIVFFVFQAFVCFKELEKVVRAREELNGCAFLNRTRGLF
jgi:hypothetical protein